MNEAAVKPNVEEICRPLRDFQRASVEYAFRRLYQDSDKIDRFLVADEVGLGKTWVAKGVIAHAVERLWDTKDRIDVLYICSNAEIARQNINRLNLGERREDAFASRLTLLPLHLGDLNARKVNFISFTPATSLEFGTSSGARRERAVLYWLLSEIWDLRGAGPKNVLQATAGLRSWRNLLDEVQGDLEQQDGFAPIVVERFTEELRADPSLLAEFERLCELFGRARLHVPPDERRQRNELIAKLRRALARSCLAIFEPDLIILDEFQRFRNLLQGEDEAAQLAQRLFTSSGSKILLLSATPYKMYTVSAETDGDDHYRDFLLTCGFLLPKPQVEALEQELMTYRVREHPRTAATAPTLVRGRRPARRHAALRALLPLHDARREHRPAGACASTVGPPHTGGSGKADSEPDLRAAGPAHSYARQPQRQAGSALVLGSALAT